MARYNFINITLEDEADITDVMNNFNKIEENGAIIDDLPKVADIVLNSKNWIKGDQGYEYTITNQLIKPEPYNIKVIFSDLSLIKNAIIPAPNSQQAGSIILRTKSAPTQDLNAVLIVTKGVKN